MEFTEREQELRDGIKLLLNLLEVRTDVVPLTIQEHQALMAYNDNCSIHIYKDTYCRACNGIIMALTCKEGNPTVNE